MATKELARFVVETHLSKIPEEAVGRAKKCILDGLGVTLAGSQQKTGRIAVELVRAMGGNSQSGLLGCGFKTSPPLAAFANGIMAHALDYDDYSEGGIWHPTAVILPAGLAIGEAKGISGDRFLEAYVIGWEIGARVSRGARRKLIGRGWHPTAWLGSLASAAASAKILGLPEESTVMALGIAGSAAAGLIVNVGTDTKPFHAGNAAKNGIIAAMLAEKGFTSNASAIEHAELGLCEVLSGETCDEEAMVQELGKDFDIISSGECIKPYPACGATHTCINAILDLVEEHRFSAEDVMGIVAETPPIVSKILFYHQPKTALEGKFSLEYCIASAVLDRESGLRQFTDEMVQRPEAQELVRKVKLYHPPDAPVGGDAILGYPQRVTIQLKNGRLLSKQLDYPRGHAKNPMSFAEVEEKFRSCAQGRLSQGAIDQIIADVKNLEKVKGIKSISELATFGCPQ